MHDNEQAYKVFHKKQLVFHVSVLLMLQKALPNGDHMVWFGKYTFLLTKTMLEEGMVWKIKAFFKRKRNMVQGGQPVCIFNDVAIVEII